MHRYAYVAGKAAAGCKDATSAAIQRGQQRLLLCVMLIRYLHVVTLHKHDYWLTVIKCHSSAYESQCLSGDSTAIAGPVAPCATHHKWVRVEPYCHSRPEILCHFCPDCATLTPKTGHSYPKVCHCCPLMLKQCRSFLSYCAIFHRFYCHKWCR